MTTFQTRRGALGLFAAGIAGALLPGCGTAAGAQPPIRVGVLHSLSGGMAPSERAVALATRMAIDVWNGDFPPENETIPVSGPMDGRLEIVEGDGASDPAVFATEARRLITEESVSVLFGCWTSSSRRAVRRVVEELGNFLVYPLQYEGLESSPNVLYTGATPNQQILPAVRWALETQERSRVYLVGSDYIFPRVANEVIRDQLGAIGLAPVGEQYLPLDASVGHTQMAAEIVADIRRSRADLVVSTLNGLANNASFFKALRAAVPAKVLPSLSFSIGAHEARGLARLGVSMQGDYAAWTYLADPTAPTSAFWTSFLAWAARKGVPAAELPGELSDPMWSAVAGVRLWASAVASAGAAALRDPALRRAALAGHSAPVPGGRIFVDGESLHVWKPLVIGRFTATGALVEVHRSPLAARPRPFPAFRTKQAWERLIVSLDR
ncbi:MAG: transporter substrate-binding protein [Pseudomonadota bacterium]|nr:transporter substrate-binding protein [Pseudomonadota bacterium]